MDHTRGLTGGAPHAAREKKNKCVVDKDDFKRARTRSRRLVCVAREFGERESRISRRRRRLRRGRGESRGHRARAPKNGVAGVGVS